MKYWFMPIIGALLAVLNVWNVQASAADGLNGLNILLPAIAFLGFGPLAIIFVAMGKRSQNDALKWFGSFFGFFAAFTGVCALATMFTLIVVAIFLPLTY